MATAESVKNKIHGLIAEANAATGNNDTDLTTAVESLVFGYGQVDAVLETLEITKNGEYTPPDGVDGFSKVVANVAGGGSSGANGIYMAQITPAEDLENLTVNHNLGTTDILCALCWAETLGDITPTFNGTLGKFWTKTDIPNQRSAIGNNTYSAYSTTSAYAVLNAPTSSNYWDEAASENTFKFRRGASAAAKYIAGVTYTVIIIAASAFSATEV